MAKLGKGSAFTRIALLGTWLEDCRFITMSPGFYATPKSFIISLLEVRQTQRLAAVMALGVFFFHKPIGFCLALLTKDVWLAHLSSTDSVWHIKKRRMKAVIIDLWPPFHLLSLLSPRVSVWNSNGVFYPNHFARWPRDNLTSAAGVHLTSLHSNSFGKSGLDLNWPQVWI